MQRHVGDGVVGNQGNDGACSHKRRKSERNQGTGARLQDGADEGQKRRGQVHSLVGQGQELVSLALDERKSPQLVCLLEKRSQRRQLNPGLVQLAQYAQLRRL